MGGKGSGPKHKTITRERALQSLTQKLPKAIEVIGETIEGRITDRLRYEAAVEVKDSVMGKPKATTELTGAEGEVLGAGAIVKLFQMMDERKRLKEGDYALQGQGTDEGSYEEVSEKDNGEG